MKIGYLWVILLSLLIISCASSNLSYFPTTEWKYSTPEEQDMDSELLAKMFEFLIDQKEAIQSFVIIRNGYIVAEAYKHPYTKESRYHIFSCTKSITSALMGIAVKDGQLNVDEKITDIFSMKNIANMDDQMMVFQ